MESVGIPECKWAEGQPAWREGEPPEDPGEAQKELQAYMRRLDEHAITCPICQRRRAYWEEHPLPPFPNEGFLGRLITLSHRFYLWRDARRRRRSAV
jgi:hypothetical protein